MFIKKILSIKSVLTVCFVAKLTFFYRTTFFNIFWFFWKSTLRKLKNGRIKFSNVCVLFSSFLHIEGWIINFHSQQKVRRKKMLNFYICRQNSLINNIDYEMMTKLTITSPTKSKCVIRIFTRISFYNFVVRIFL